MLSVLSLLTRCEARILVVSSPRAATSIDPSVHASRTHSEGSILLQINVLGFCASWVGWSFVARCGTSRAESWPCLPFDSDVHVHSSERVKLPHHKLAADAAPRPLAGYTRRSDSGALCRCTHAHTHALSRARIAAHEKELRAVTQSSSTIAELIPLLALCCSLLCSLVCSMETTCCCNGAGRCSRHVASPKLGWNCLVFSCDRTQ